MTRFLMEDCLHLAPEDLYDWPKEEIGSRIAELRASSKLHVVKTHEQPTGDSYIYIIRDGRAATASLHHYIHDVLGHSVPIVNLVTQRGDPRLYWSDHVRDWEMLRAPRRMVLRYESLVRNPMAQVARISKFLDRPIVSPPVRTFASCQAWKPHLFRIGENGPGIAEVEAQCSELFWHFHGPAMRRYGYASASDGAAAQSPTQGSAETPPRPAPKARSRAA
jgi:hypothetical protein